MARNNRRAAVPDVLTDVLAPAISADGAACRISRPKRRKAAFLGTVSVVITGYAWLVASGPALAAETSIIRDSQGNVVGEVPLVTTGPSYYADPNALFLNNQGAAGNDGRDCGDETGKKDATDGGDGGDGQDVRQTVTYSSPTGGSLYGTLAVIGSGGGQGGDGGSNRPGSCNTGGRDAGDGGDGGYAHLTVNPGSATTVYDFENTAIVAQTLGGDGGEGGGSVDGGASGQRAEGGDGGNGGQAIYAFVGNNARLNVTGGPTVFIETVTDDMGTSNESDDETTTITHVVNTAHGIVMQSGGGVGGVGGASASKDRPGGSGGRAGNAGAVWVGNFAPITTAGGSAIAVQSIGGFGGHAGLNKKGYGGGGGGGGDGQTAYVHNDGALTVGRQALPDCSESVTSDCNVTGAYGIYAQSVGGGGGNSGGTAKRRALGADGGDAGYGFVAQVVNTGSISLHTPGSTGIFAQSIGGGGGSGGMAFAKGHTAIAIGGSGGGGGYGGTVSVENAGDICTGGACGLSYDALAPKFETAGGAAGIFAQSVGGGGGAGGSAEARSAGFLFWGGSSLAIGGSGGDGGRGLGVNVASSGNILTAEINSPGIFAQSIGGGGGTGGGALAMDVSLMGGKAVAHGGSGGGGGSGGQVSVNCIDYGSVAAGAAACLDASYTVNTPSQTLTTQLFPVLLSTNDGGRHTIATAGLGSPGIVAQSVGGGGGSGGYAISLAASVVDSVLPTTALAFGGSGGSGGSGGPVYAGTNGLRLNTLGDSSPGIVAQSIGGGGGAGGYAIDVSLVTVGAPVGMSIGGSGGSGGAGGAVVADNPGGTIFTAGDYSHGIAAASIGGGGGSGGAAVSAGYAGVGSALSLAIGGSGGKGGNASTVSVHNRNADAGISGAGGADITTLGYGASAIAAQSIGGGGGGGGFSMAGAVSLTASGAIAIGGNGGSGNNGANVYVENFGALTTLGGGAAALSAQSIGGGGGNGGFAASGAVSLAAGAIGVGGKGGGGARSGDVTVRNSGAILVSAENEPEPYAPLVPDSSLNQALEAWTMVAGGEDMSAPPEVTALYNLITGQANPRLATTISNAPGILAQSIGGGGGAGGFAASAGVAGAAASIAVGGTGGKGGTAEDVDVENTGAIIVQGEQSPGITAMSIGGTGGLGGLAVGASVGVTSMSASVGGNGGSGGTAGDIRLSAANASLQAPVMTQGGMSPALQALSIGGTGGNGGFSVGSAVGATLGSASLSLGGNGGGGGAGGDIDLESSQYLSTSGLLSPGVLAMSMGGGGGMGGLTAAVASSTKASFATAVGGAGGNGGLAGSVNVTTNMPVVTYGNLSSGVVANSIGGSGGMGGMAISSAVLVSGIAPDMAVNVGTANGGNGGDGNDGASVTVNSNHTIQTYGFASHAIMAQSLGGSGGNGGFALDASVAVETTPVPTSINSGAAVGGKGAAGGDSGGVTVNQTGTLISGFGLVESGQPGAALLSSGILAQSIGGSGGNGGSAITLSSGNSLMKSAVAIGSGGGKGGHGGAVTVDSNAACATAQGCGQQIMTFGAGAPAIEAQSIGGGGGNGGHAISAAGASGFTGTMGIGGFGGDGGNGAAVRITAGGSLTTMGFNSPGLLAQSIGGGGGNGGSSHTSMFAPGTVLKRTLALFGQDVGTDNDDAVAASQKISESDGARSYTRQESDWPAATSAMSLGGGGGKGGSGAAVTVNSTARIAAGASGLGRNSPGILAQSVGGGGGNGGVAVSGQIGVAAASTLLGGSSRIAGDGGQVSVTAANVVMTSGGQAPGVAAQSIGGGGGNAGQSFDFSSTHASMAFGAGMTGGNGGVGGGVTVNNSALILTEGMNSAGVLAQSVGGGGGNASGSLIANLLPGAQTDSISAATYAQTGSRGSLLDGGFARAQVNDSERQSGQSGTDGGLSSSNAMGSANGSGGSGGAVTVRNTAAIFTGARLDETGLVVSGESPLVSAQSSAIFAQSVGGGGGSMGAAAVDANSGKSSVAAVLGGSGSGVGAGGAVIVANAGSLSTSSVNSSGIFAQSVGGGGGGSSAFLGMSGVNAGLAGAASQALQLGGSQSSARGGEVTVCDILDGDQCMASAGHSVVTTEAGSYGIFAQAVGGGGGAASAISTALGDALLGSIVTGGASASVDGASVIAQATRGVAFAAALGATGGNGTGNYVSVRTAASIRTEGAGASGIFAQSVGGGGGVAVSHVVNASSGAHMLRGVLGVDGGKGGGHNVSVSASGGIATFGDLSHGVLAQSVGGGGGVLHSTNHSAGIGDLDAIIALGAISGGAGDGGEVSVQLAGPAPVTIETHGRSAYGVLAQSVGGGGGLAALVLDPRHDGKAVGGWGVSGRLGMERSANSDHIGAAVSLSADDLTVAATGSRSGGVVVQSIGGGGGVLTVSIPSQSYDPGIGMQMGALGGGTGANGGAVSVNLGASNAVSAISTAADMAPALVAQSVGGGGGLAQIHAPTLTMRGSAARGGAVTVTNASTISTAGAAAPGIVAQSIGGGGGLGWAGVSFTWGGASSGSDGNDVTVNSDAPITTTGINAHGILAQSVGGGGGTALSLGNSVTNFNYKGAGNAGDVTVRVNAPITTWGDGAHGVVAQSAAGGGGLVQNGTTLTALYGGGSGKPGDVIVHADADIVVHGKGARAIFATASKDPIVEIATDVRVTGGADGGSAVFFDAEENELRNSGILSTQDGAAGMAVRSLIGDTRVTNNSGGVVLGSIHLSAGGDNLIHNMAGGTLRAGALLDAGTAGELRNEGMLELGSESIGATTIVGDLVQTGTGVLRLRLDPSTGATDAIHITGSAHLAGSFAPVLVNAERLQPGALVASIVSVDGDLDMSQLTVADSVAIVDYQLTQGADGLSVMWTTDFTPAGLSAGGQEVGGFLGALQANGGSPLSRALTAILAQAEDISALEDVYQDIGGGGASAIPVAALQSATLAMGAVTQRLDGWRMGDAGSFTPDTGGADGKAGGVRSWAGLRGLSGSGDGRSSDLYSLAFGMDAEHAGVPVLLGAAASYTWSSYELDRPDVTGNGSEFGVNIYGAGRVGSAYLAWDLYGGGGDLSRNSHLVNLGVNGSADFDYGTLGARLEAGYAIDVGDSGLRLTPFAALQPVVVRQDDAREIWTGLDAVLDFDETTTVSAPLHLGFQLDGSWRTQNGAVLTSFLKAAWMHDLETDRSVMRSFPAEIWMQNLPAGHSLIEGLPTRTRMNGSGPVAVEDAAIIQLGAQYSLDDRVTLIGAFDTQFSSGYESVGGTLNVRFSW